MVLLLKLSLFPVVRNPWNNHRSLVYFVLNLSGTKCIHKRIQNSRERTKPNSQGHSSMLPLTPQSIQALRLPNEYYFCGTGITGWTSSSHAVPFAIQYKLLCPRMQIYIPSVDDSSHRSIVGTDACKSHPGNGNTRKRLNEDQSVCRKQLGSMCSLEQYTVHYYFHCTGLRSLFATWLCLVVPECTVNIDFMCTKLILDQCVQFLNTVLLPRRHMTE